MRRDAKFCSGNCQVAHFRTVRRAGDVLPFTLPAIPGIDDDPAAEAADAAIRAIVAPFKHQWGGDLSPEEAAMAEVARAEEHLKMARRAARKVFKNTGRDTEAMFSGSTFVLRSSAEKWIAEAKAESIKTLLAPDPPKKYESSKIAQARGWAALALREEEESRLVPPAPQDAEAREQAVRARWEAATAEERARMITEVANRKGVVRPPRSNK